MIGMTFVLNNHPPGGVTSGLGFDVIKVLGRRLWRTERTPIYASRHDGHTQVTHFYLLECWVADGYSGPWRYREIIMDDLMDEVAEYIYLVADPSGHAARVCGGDAQRSGGALKDIAEMGFAGWLGVDDPGDGCSK